MPAVLTMASKLVCVHGGTVQIPPVSHPLSVDGQAVLVQNDVMNAPIPDCPNKGSPGLVPCTLITAVTAGLSTTLTVSGQAVLLATAQGLTNGAPPLPVLWQVQSAGQSKLAAT
jgi:hypothetical protein